MANDHTDEYPSSPGQWDLARLLEKQLQEMGAKDVELSSHGIVVATIPGNVATAPTIAFNAHLDTSPETSAHNVDPQVIRQYGGGDIPLAPGSDKIITVSKCPELLEMVGKTLITTDGNTLLGGDDKAGVAIIMEIAQHLLENPHIPRGDLRVIFTCDEEIGRGTAHVDIEHVNAVACYTFDGGGQNNIDIETFSADSVTLTFHGANIHPAIAKDKMINALRIAGNFLARLPSELSPERTAGREGFIHPYQFEGTVASATIRAILRSFDTPQLDVYAAQLNQLATEVVAEYPGSSFTLQVHRQYRNLNDGLKQHPKVVELAVKAHERLGRKPKLEIIRGGTDGSQFTEKGLPTPNLSSGQHNIHSPLEFACLDEMLAACEVGVELVKAWGE
ncbi:MAG TPA: peptidase T [Pirellulaceae bacterium]|nr:peptidase T [Pirellulaceae bacterium]HMO91839.1 peptidase T [Pirellulaceae bacterium]HMP69902.1 peptidase T [Pirellulaceae bacterium]